MSKKENMFHPTAGDLVKLVLESNPTIGQATVYRNINKLVDEGILLKIPTTNNFRYDINTHTHAHLTCKECGSVIDLYDGDYQKIVSNLESKYNVKIDDLVKENIELDSLAIETEVEKKEGKKTSKIKNKNTAF